MQKIDYSQYNRKLITIPCNLCGSKEFKTLYKETRFKTGIKVVICKRCGLVFLNPRWTTKAYAEFYKKDYRILMGEEKLTLDQSHLQERIHGSQILEFCGDYVTEGSRILDIGSSSGGILWAFKNGKNCKIYGVEPSIERSEYTKKTLGANVKTGLFEEIDFKNERFDLITITQTLNHLLDPSGSIVRIRNLLKNNGLLFLEVQNFPEYDKFSLRSTQVDHSYYFSVETILNMLNKIGFEPVKIEVDTASSAKTIARFMWHRGAFIHVRVLAKKVLKPKDKIEYSNYLSHYKMLRRNHMRKVPRIIASKIIDIIRKR